METACDKHPVPSAVGSSGLLNVIHRTADVVPNCALRPRTQVPHGYRRHFLCRHICPGLGRDVVSCEQGQVEAAVLTPSALDQRLDERCHVSLLLVEEQYPSLTLLPWFARKQPCNLREAVRRMGPIHEPLDVSAPDRLASPPERGGSHGAREVIRQV